MVYVYITREELLELARKSAPVPDDACLKVGLEFETNCEFEPGDTVKLQEPLILCFVWEEPEDATS